MSLKKSTASQPSPCWSCSGAFLPRSNWSVRFATGRRRDLLPHGTHGSRTWRMTDNHDTARADNMVLTVRLHIPPRSESLGNLNAFIHDDSAKTRTAAYC